jgi:hypothetical protein
MPAGPVYYQAGLQEDPQVRRGWNVDMAGDMADQAFSIVEAEFPDKKYGVDWVNIGWRPGNEVLLQKYLQSIDEGAQGKDISITRRSARFRLCPSSRPSSRLPCALIFCTGIMERPRISLT